MREITGIIGPDNSYRKIEYYDIYEFAKKKCLEYASKSEENYNKFYWFNKEYKTFEPYLDFFLCRLGYAIVNPMNYHNVIEYGNKGTDRITFKKVEDLNKPLDYLKQENILDSTDYEKCSEIALNIRNFTTDIEDDGIILPNGKFLTVDRKINTCHEMVAVEILNQYITRNKELYEDYINYIMNFYNNKPIDSIKNSSEFAIIKYLNRYLGCIWFVNFLTSCNYMYNSRLLTEETRKIIEVLERNPENDKNDITLPENVKKYQKIIKKIYKEEVSYE